MRVTQTHSCNQCAVTATPFNKLRDMVTHDTKDVARHEP